MFIKYFGIGWNYLQVKIQKKEIQIKSNKQKKHTCFLFGNFK